jgi:hypothetical protein
MFDNFTTKGTQLMAIYSPYTYLIGWSRLNTWYYGVRYARKSQCLYESGCHPDELWVTYFTSSEYVKEFREKYGEPDIIQVRKVFDCDKFSKDCLAKMADKWEKTVLKRLDVLNNNKWLNKNIAGSYLNVGGSANPLKGNTYENVYGNEKASEWQENRRQGNLRWWKSEEGKIRKAYLEKNRSKNFTTLGKSPSNKIFEQFELLCEFCGKTKMLTKTKENLDKKSCGSKSCAAKWSHKYKKIKVCNGDSNT